MILGLVQVGGFGFMTGSTLLLLLFVGGRTGLRDRVLAQASTGGMELGGVLAIVRRSRLFTVVVEAARRASSCSPRSSRRVATPRQSAWFGVFHSITAFNNAGFDLFGGFRCLARLRARARSSS